VAGSIIGLYYYLRIIVTKTGSPLTGAAGGTSPAIRLQGRQLGNAVLAALVLLLIGLGAYPAPLLTLIRATASMAAR
jgi:NADH:ubiquinone oxidoreductase subunit 2 (subunit N)